MAVRHLVDYVNPQIPFFRQRLREQDQNRSLTPIEENSRCPSSGCSTPPGLRLIPRRLRRKQRLPCWTEKSNPEPETHKLLPSCGSHQSPRLRFQASVRSLLAAAETNRLGFKYQQASPGHCDSVTEMPIQMPNTSKPQGHTREIHKQNSGHRVGWALPRRIASGSFGHERHDSAWPQDRERSESSFELSLPFLGRKETASLGWWRKRRPTPYPIPGLDFDLLFDGDEDLDGDLDELAIQSRLEHEDVRCPRDHEVERHEDHCWHNNDVLGRGRDSERDDEQYSSRTNGVDGLWAADGRYLGMRSSSSPRIEIGSEDGSYPFEGMDTPPLHSVLGETAQIRGSMETVCCPLDWGEELTKVKYSGRSDNQFSEMEVVSRWALVQTQSADSHICPRIDEIFMGHRPGHWVCESCSASVEN